MKYERTKEALELYDFEPTAASRDLVQVTFWLEASTEVRAQLKNPTIENIRVAIESA